MIYGDETKKFNKTVIACYPKIIQYQNISETQGPPYEVFQYCETRKIDKIVTPLLHKYFWYQKLSETLNGSLTLFCGDLGLKFPTETRDTPFSSNNFFHTRNFLKHGRVHPRCFSATWDRKFPTENVTPACLSLTFFRTRNFLKHNTVPLKNFSVLRNRKFSTQNRDISLIWRKFYKTRKSETIEVSPTIVSVPWDIKKLQKIVLPPPPPPPPPPPLTDKGDIPLMQKFFRNP